MGSTVSTAKLATAFKAACGKTMYVLFEETYESNCYPRTPSWCALMIGDIQAVMRGIFRSARSCEGGMLKGAGGRDITPEGYISGWLQQLANPVELNDRTFEIFTSDSMYAPISSEEFPAIQQMLAGIGRQSEADALGRGEKISVSLYADAVMLAAMYDGYTLGAWRIFRQYSAPLHGPRNPSLGYAPEKAKGFAIEVPRFLLMDARLQQCLRQDENGDWRNDGDVFSYVGDYVRGLWESELREPGSYRARIKAFREAVKTAPLMPENAFAILDPNIEVESWERDTIERVIADVPHTAVGQEIRFDKPTDYTQFYRLTQLSGKCTKWIVDAPTSDGQQSPIQQLDLLAG